MDTGTGKTLSLLSPILSLIEKDEECKLIYASRTHSQLKQVKKELRKTRFSKMISSVHIASRDNYCVNSNVRRNLKGEELNKECCI